MKHYGTLVLFGLMGSLAFAETVIPMRALCYESESECVRMRGLVGARSALPLYSYVQPCVRDTFSDVRGRTFCARGDWRVLAQVRTSWSEATLRAYFAKFGRAPLRATCTSSCQQSSAIMSAIRSGAAGNWTSVKGDYTLALSCRKMTQRELAKFQNHECHDKDYLVEYFLVPNR